MWEKIFDYGKQLVSVLQRLQKHEDDIRQLNQNATETKQELNRQRDEIRNLTRLVERLFYEIQRSNDRTESDREKAEADRRILLLEIENRFLRHERSLPPAEPPKLDAP